MPANAARTVPQRASEKLMKAHVLTAVPIVVSLLASVVVVTFAVPSPAAYASAPARNANSGTARAAPAQSPHSRCSAALPARLT